jgi:rhamnulokinase
MDKHYLAIDLGAESGRVMLGTLSHGEDPERSRMDLEEIHRFPNGAVTVDGSLRWDLPRLFAEARSGLAKAAFGGEGAPGSRPVSGISADAWGVDYALLKDGLSLLEPAHHYRDARTDGAMERVFARVPAEAIFRHTGIQFMSLNTLYQLFTDLADRGGVLEAAEGFLNVGDWFNALLSGVAKGEMSLASTTQLFDPRMGPSGHGDWAWELIDRLGLPRRIFPPLVPPGTVLGPLRPGVLADAAGLPSGAQGLGALSGAQVVATCSHDTAAAVAAVPALSGPGPANGEGTWAFLSSGTWSLLGVELEEPVIDEASRARNFTNEVGYGGSIMFRKNIVGLWIVQECRRAWAEAGEEIDYAALTALAERAAPFRSFIRPEDPRFAKPGGMPGKIADFCRETGQAVPQGPGAMVRCVLESLALLYAKTLRECAECSAPARRGRPIAALHVVGGGSRNALLNRLTAGAVQLAGVERVTAGPAECTALGNVLVQAKALGHLAGDLRGTARRSSTMEEYLPRDREAWNAALRRFEALPAPA